MTFSCQKLGVLFDSGNNHLEGIFKEQTNLSSDMARNLPQDVTLL
jgi:hypothetical protein